MSMLEIQSCSMLEGVGPFCVPKCSFWGNRGSNGAGGTARICGVPEGGLLGPLRLTRNGKCGAAEAGAMPPLSTGPGRHVEVFYVLSACHVLWRWMLNGWGLQEAHHPVSCWCSPVRSGAVVGNVSLMCNFAFSLLATQVWERWDRTVFSPSLCAALHCSILTPMLK